MNHDLFARLAEKYPFITLCVYASTEYVGIIQNQDSAVTTIYDFGSIQHPEIKQRFIELANVWWWESNRSIPINIFLKGDWDIFRPYLRTFTNKDLEILHGPVCSLGEMVSTKKQAQKHYPGSADLTEQIHVQGYQGCVPNGMCMFEHKSATGVAVPH
jgi:hypothetical protein